MAHTVIIILLWVAMLASPCLAALTVDLDAEDARDWDAKGKGSAENIGWN